MSGPLTIRVLLVDDHPLVRQGLSHLIGGQDGMEVCGQAAAAGEGQFMVRELNPDVVVLDLMLGRGNGLELIKSLLDEFPHLHILVLSMHGYRVYAERCLRAGAKGYLRKEDAADQVVEALRTVARGEHYPKQHALAGAAASPIEAPLARLSDREMRVFELIGSGLPTRAIATQLALSDKTVEAHKANLKRKLSLAHGSELVRVATEWWEHGRG